jgi:hypothetical protein
MGLVRTGFTGMHPGGIRRCRKNVIPISSGKQQLKRRCAILKVRLSVGNFLLGWILQHLRTLQMAELTEPRLRRFTAVGRKRVGDGP